jgi:hypothetical protein
MTVRIRTTMRPHEEIEVGEGEARDLERMGALVEPPASTTGDTPARQPKTAGK